MREWFIKSYYELEKTSKKIFIQELVGKLLQQINYRWSAPNKHDMVNIDKSDL